MNGGDELRVGCCAAAVRASTSGDSDVSFDDDASEREAGTGESVVSDTSPRMRRPTNSGLDVPARAAPITGEAIRFEELVDDDWAPNAGVEAPLDDDVAFARVCDAGGCA